MFALNDKLNTFLKSNRTSKGKYMIDWVGRAHRSSCITCRCHSHMHSLSLSHTHTHIHTLSLSHTGAAALRANDDTRAEIIRTQTLFLSHTYTRSHFLSRSFSLSHTHTLTHSVSLSHTGAAALCADDDTRADVIRTPDDRRWLWVPTRVAL